MPTACVYNLPADAKTRERIQLLAGYLLNLGGQSPDTPTTWLYPVRWEPLDIDPETEADGVVGNVFKFLSERYGIKGHLGNALTFEKMPLKSMAAYGANDSELRTKLAFVYYEKSLYAFILGNEGSPDDANIQPWIEALAHAEQERSTGHAFHEWIAVVGPAATSKRQTPTLCEDELTIGELTLQPCKFAYEERRPLASLTSWSPFQWVPLVVRGRSRGHDWRSAEFAALREVHHLCGLLSVETASHWALKEAPRPIEWGSIHFPDETPLGLIKCDTYNERTDAEHPTVSIDSARLAHMWQRCIEDASLGAPVEAYYEAVSLRDSHPSFALVGFVATIEEVGKLLIDAPPPTERCPTCNKEKTNSSAERFRAALRLVLPEGKLQAVSRDLYRWRSGTAHAGRTYSWESSFGRPLMGDSLLVSPLQSTFSVKGPMHADELARDLLLVLLNGEDAIASVNSAIQ